MSDTEIIWEAPPIIKPEFRLYYNDDGSVLTYSCDKLIGKYIVIDAMTFAQCRPDIRIVDGVIIKDESELVTTKLVPGESGVMCDAEDVSVISINGILWEMKKYER